MSHDKESLQRMFLSLQANNEKLENQFKYLRQHVDASSLPPAEGALRELQLKTVAFAKEVTNILASYNMTPFMFAGALLGYKRHDKGFVPWDDDIDFALMGADFWRLIDVIREDFILLDLPKHNNMWALLDNAFRKHPNKIIGLQTPFCLHLYKGKSLEDCVNIEFMPYYYWNDSATSKDYTNHAKEIHALLAKQYSWEKLFSCYKEIFANNPLYCEKSHKIGAGVGNFTLTNWKFPGFYTKDQVFPLQNIMFENVELPTLNNIEHHLQAVYGDYMQLPSDIGITVTSSVVHAYLQTQNRTLNMPEASVTCKHKG